MSRLWPERLLVSLEPAAVNWVRLAGGLRTRVVADGSLAADPAHGAEPWQGALAALRAGAGTWQRERLNVNVALSNHFVRYARLPAAGQDATQEEEIALARFHLGKIHGDRARGWDVRISDNSSGPRLACAVDSGLIAGLRAGFPRRSKARLVSVQPYLISAFNLWRSRIPRAGAWLMLIEPDRSCFALYAAGGWHAVHNARGASRNPADWAALLERERRRAESAQPPSTVLVCSPSDWAVANETVGPWNFARVAPRDPRFPIAFTAQ